MNSKQLLRLAGTVAASMALLGAGCGSSSSPSTSSASNAEAQSAAAGDIPDNQQFLVFKNLAAGYSIKYPEGWARKGPPNNITFADKDNQVQVSISTGSLPSPGTAKAALEHSRPSTAKLRVTSAKTEAISGQKAVHITYDKLGPKDPVTGKQLTLMVDRYVLAKGGKVATVDESTPVGVDNVDAYRLIIESFTWL